MNTTESLKKQLLLKLKEDFEKKVFLITEKYKSDIEKVKSLTTYTENSEDSIKILPKQKKANFHNKLVKILENENQPLTSKELMAKAHEIEPEKRYIFFTFSGMLSHLRKKETSKITMITFPGADISFKFFYALKKWTDSNGNLKIEYLNKIKNRTVINEPLWK